MSRRAPLRGSRAGATLLALALLASCTSRERSILITARSVTVDGATGIDSIVVHVIPTASSVSPAPARSEPVVRTFEEIAGELPIHVAIHLLGPTPVMVHLVALTNTGERLFATRCYAPDGVIADEVLLVPRDRAADVDGDGFPGREDVAAACRDPGPGPTGIACDQGLCPGSVGGDCDDAVDVIAGSCDRDHASEGRCIHPGAETFCGDGIDQDCRDNGGTGGDEPCTDLDLDGYSACAPSAVPDGGVVTDGGIGDAGAMPDRGCDCSDMNRDVHPGAVEVCGNMVDDDCSGEPGGLGAHCDVDGDGFTANVDCDDARADIHPGGLSLEQCCAAPPCAEGCECDGVDNNCNGLRDEHSSCAGPDLDGDGHDFCMGGVTSCASCDCNDCDSGIHPGAIDACGDEVDADEILGDAVCEASDVDQDSVVGGRDCDEGDPRTFLDAPEDCRTPASESCGTGTCGVDADMDGYSPSGPGVVDCDDTDPDVHPWATEICNGVNDDCDADGDEVLDRAGTAGCVTDPSCVGSARCLITFAGNLHHCGRCRNECNPGTTLVADVCTAGGCLCSTDPDGLTCDVAANETCCGTMDGTGSPVAFPGCDDLERSMANCGGCGVVCDGEASSVCSGGICSCGAGAACGAGDTCCPRTSPADAACRDLETDVESCGACGIVCGPNSACSRGRCVCVDADQEDCNGDLGDEGGDGCEADLRSDPASCGSCGTSCNDDQVAVGSCASGACVIESCVALHADCNGSVADGCEANLASVDACGGCGTVCAVENAYARCTVTGGAAACDYGACTTGFADCDGTRANGCEASLDASTHCGSCANDCTDDSVMSGTCSSGSCLIGSCAAGRANCDGSTANGCEATTAGTPSDCCGARCGSPPMCDRTGMASFSCR